MFIVITNTLFTKQNIQLKRKKSIFIHTTDET